MIIALMFNSCENNQAPQSVFNRGYVEYQYNDTTITDSVKHTFTVSQLYYRVDLRKAVLSLPTNPTMPDSLKNKFMQVDLCLFSDSLNTDTIHQSLNSSMVKMSLVDSVKNMNIPSYNIAAMYSNSANVNSFISAKIKFPSCIGFNASMTKKSDSSYKYIVKTADLTPSVKLNIFDLGDGIYQISSTGLYDSKRYNIYFVGKLEFKN